jgi:hypothetical protein
VRSTCATALSSAAVLSAADSFACLESSMVASKRSPGRLNPAALARQPCAFFARGPLLDRRPAAVLGTGDGIHGAGENGATF